MTLDVSQISPLGFGVSGPHRGDGVDRPQTLRLIREAIDLGISVFDTAPKYGDGEAESRLGEALKGANRDKLFIVTKAGIVDETARRDFSPAGIRASLEGSLKRLGLDHIDALLLQGAATGELNEDLYEGLAQLKADGLVRYIGASGRGEELDTPITADIFDIIMAPNYAGMPIDQTQRLVAAQDAGKRIFAIEGKNGAKQTLKLPLGKSDLWYFGRQLKRWMDRWTSAPVPPTGKLSILEAFKWSLDSERTDCLMVQTTNSEHLIQLAQLAGLDVRAGSA